MEEPSPCEDCHFPPEVLGLQTGDEKRTLAEGSLGFRVDVFVIMNDVRKKLRGAITDEKPDANYACHRGQNDAN